MEYKKLKSDGNASYEKLKADLKNGEPGRCYVFHGQEQYLLRHSLEKLRALLCPGGLDSFNYKRFDEGSITAAMFGEAIEALPMNARRTLIEVHDYQIFSKAGKKATENEAHGTGDADDTIAAIPDLVTGSDRAQICAMLGGLPEHVCVVFVYTEKEFNSGDKRLKTTKAILQNIEVVEFGIQGANELVQWIKRHFRSAGKEISTAEARYLTEITDGLMMTLKGEIEKIAAYAKGQHIERSDIDAVAVPVIDAVVYKLTDAVVRRDGKGAMQILDRLFQMHEVPHKLFFSISNRMRQLLAARICIDNKAGKAQFAQMCSIPKNLEFTVGLIMGTAAKASLEYCRNAVLMCSQTAVELNSTSEAEARITELVAKLSLVNTNNV